MGKRYGLIGHPVGHSMSPLMHNEALLALGLDAVYEAFDVREQALAPFMTKLRNGELDGINVTIPHKVAVMDFLDEVDEVARQIGAVNTIVKEDGKLVGYNTDGVGYWQSVEPFITTPYEQQRVLIIGAGGAARAVTTAFLQAGVGQLIVCNRTVEKAVALLNRLNTQHVTTDAWSLKKAETELERFDIIVNTTSVGMSPNIDDQPLSLQRMKCEAIVSDLIYNPLETAFLQEAKQRGATTINGLGMFVNQGALSFQYWTDQAPDRMRMTDSVIKKLGG
ncbi:shikimate dehydrogenase [Bacillus sp. FJAT-45037]|uniref:shikimate dehydrogenase n=1 Tax=Bacillus sp. FJAT-45037 TaxID=2011007 RepID=UPI000C24676D|nr:shikimate dehydrogenase [Bacillus sp. FJAT-45037]